MNNLVLPIPPLSMRQLVGGPPEEAFENPAGMPALADVPLHAYESVLDFGSGCGRVARQMILQTPRPGRYLGIDLHRGMVDWCRDNLSPAAAGFRFEHHDVFNPGFNPDRTRPNTLPIPAGDRSFSLVLAWSVFTHTTQSQTEHYLREAARVLQPGGTFVSTWFMFEKRYFPMMQDFQNALYINEHDATNATIFDRSWLALFFRVLGLKVIRAEPPALRGFQWLLHIAHVRDERPAVDLPPDAAPFGHLPPPVMTEDAAAIGR